MRFKLSIKLSKIIIPIIAGVACFFLSPFSKSYEIGNTVINIPWVLIFPILITLAYGYKEGLLAALFGGALFPFILWEENGWANIINSLNIIVLLLVIGFIFNNILKEKEKRKVISVVVIIISYLLFYSFIYLIAFEFFLKLNPPFWTDNTVNSYPNHVIISIYIKNLINYSLIIIFSEALLKLPPFRRLFGLNTEKWMRKNNKVFILSIMAALIIWLIFYLLDLLLNTNYPKEMSENYLTISFMLVFWSAGLLGRILIGFIETNLKIRDALIEREEKYKAQYNYYPLPVYTIKKNHEGKLVFTDINKAAKNYKYATTDNIIGLEINKFLITDTEREISEIIDNVLITKKNDSVDIFYHYKTSGQKRYLNLTFGYIPPEIILMTVKDITEEKYAQDALKESEEKYRTMIEAFPDIIMLSDLNSNILFGNDSLTRITGITQDDFNNPDRKAQIHSDDREYIAKTVKELLENDLKHSELIENRFIDSWGKEHWFSGVISKLKLNNKLVLQTISRDITEQKNAELRLKQSEEIYRAQYNYFPIPVLTIKQKEGQLVFDNINEATKNYPFIESEMIKNKSLSDFFSREKETFFIDIIKNIFITKETQTIEVEYLFKTTGTKRHLNVVCGFVPPDSVLLTLIDITDKKKTQEKLLYAMINAEERERSRVAKDLHDGVSPVLAAIKLYVQSFIASDDEKLRKELAEKIFNTIKETIRSVSEISNKLSPHILENFGLQVAIQNFIEKINDTSNISFDLSYQVKSEINEKVEVNLYRVIVELINNTVKYAQANKVFIKLFEEEEHIKMNFEHNGKGFNLEKVLASSKGMGLNNLFNRIQALNGTMEYNTSEDSNLKVNVTVPLS